MQKPMGYREAMGDLSGIAKEGPAYVRVKALVTIVRETSPNNPRHADVMRELGLADELGGPSDSTSGCPACGRETAAEESRRLLYEQSQTRREEEEAAEDEEDPH